MKELIKKIVLFVVIGSGSIVNAQPTMNFEFDAPYGTNEKVGKHVTINDVEIYYEVYGSGEPLLLIHGNGGSIQDMGNQIDYFKSTYRIIVADNRGHGKSGLETDSLTYIQIAKDYDGLVSHLELKDINVVGWSDGGIIGLQMGINGTSSINKIVVMGANLRPDTTAVYSWANSAVKEGEAQVKSLIANGDKSQDWNIMKQHLGLLVYQPTISHSDLKRIKAPVLVMAGDKDIIREEHTVEIYQHIENAHLCIMPGETHFTPASNPILFNAIVWKFLSEPFTRPDSDWTKG